MTRPARVGVCWVLAGALAAAAAGAWAQPTPATAGDPPGDAGEEVATVGTGDAWLDARLSDMDRYAVRHRATFVDELVRYRDAPRALVEELQSREDAAWTPGDLYMACALAQVVGRPCRAVVTQREADRAAPWAQLAEQLGAAPGSASFQRIKRGVADSYRHWGRPLVPDAPSPATAADDA